MNSRAQVSFEYLLTVLFGIVLAMIAAALTLNIASIARLAEARILEIREKMIAQIATS